MAQYDMCIQADEPTSARVVCFSYPAVIWQWARCKKTQNEIWQHSSVGCRELHPQQSRVRRRQMNAPASRWQNEMCTRGIKADLHQRRNRTIAAVENQTLGRNTCLLVFTDVVSPQLQHHDIQYISSWIGIECTAAIRPPIHNVLHHHFRLQKQLHTHTPAPPCTISIMDPAP